MYTQVHADVTGIKTFPSKNQRRAKQTVHRSERGILFLYVHIRLRFRFARFLFELIQHSTNLIHNPFQGYLGQLGFYTILFTLCWDVYYSLSGPCEFHHTWLAILYKVMGAKKKS